MAQSVEYPDLPFVVPRSWSKGRRPGCPKLIVIHYTAGHEGPDAAENGAHYDQIRTDGTSTHYHVDSNGVIQCVLTTDEAHTARARGNDLGIQYELAGTLQTREQWLDAVSDATLTFAARQAARDAKKYGIEVRRLSVSEVRAAHPDFGNKPIKGFCGHVDITYAFPEDQGDHTDPGPQFPWDIFLQRVSTFMDGGDMSTEATINAAFVEYTGSGIGGKGWLPIKIEKEVQPALARIEGLATTAATRPILDPLAVVAALSANAQFVDTLADKIAAKVTTPDPIALVAALTAALTAHPELLDQIAVAIASHGLTRADVRAEIDDTRLAGG